MGENSKLVAGVGINDANYAVVQYEYYYSFIENRNKRRMVWRCPFYTAWSNMLVRCHNINLKKRQQNYIDATCCKEWLLFSNFKAWMEQQDWEGKQLDKDIITCGGKHYSPETCTFVTAELNTVLALSDGRHKDNNLPLGVVKILKKDSNVKYRVLIGKIKKSRSFDDAFEAHRFWQQHKIKRLTNLLDKNLDYLVYMAIETAIINLQSDYDSFTETKTFPWRK